MKRSACSAHLARLARLARRHKKFHRDLSDSEVLDDSNDTIDSEVLDDRDSMGSINSVL